MALHEDKFEYICHLANKRNPLYKLPFFHEQFQYTAPTILTPMDQIRDLGITVSSEPSWTSHIRSSCDKTRKKAAWVFSVFHSRNTGVMLTLYKSLVRSHLEYCSLLWNPAKVYDIQELESVQKTFSSRFHPWFTASPLLGLPENPVPHVTSEAQRKLHYPAHVENPT